MKVPTKFQSAGDNVNSVMESVVQLSSEAPKPLNWSRRKFSFRKP